MKTSSRTMMRRTATLALISAACVSSTSAFSSPGMLHTRSTVSPQRRVVSSTPKQNNAMTKNTPRSSSKSVVLQAGLGSGGGGHLVNYLIETLISNGVPALIWIGAAAVTTKILVGAMGGGKKDSDDDLPFFDGEFGTPVDELYDDLYSTSGSSNSKNSPPAFLNNFKKPTKSPRNMGIPNKQYLTITNLNEKFDSYRYSLTAATKSKSYAAAELRNKNFNNALTKSINASPTPLSSRQQAMMLQTEKAFLKEGRILLKELQLLQRSITQSVIQEQVKDLMEKEEDADDGVIDAEIESPAEETASNNATDTTSNNTTSTIEKSDDKKKKSKKSSNKDLLKKIEKKNTEILELELDFIAELINILGLERTASIRRTLLGNINANAAPAGALLTSLQDRPLSTVLASLTSDMAPSDTEHADTRRKSLFITAFPGDVTASQVSDLREEVTGIIRSSQPGDEALLILQSGGGTVTGYGLAAAQLQRFKQHGMKLTICVEQVAASGGYMMCCVADRVVASPFAVLGSIGVISDIPNVYERLKKEGIEYQTVTAGKYKRTITPTKKVTQEDIKKSKADIEDILVLFKEFVKENRPQLDIDTVATGETWFGTDALERGLCDEIGTADDVLLHYIDEGYNVYDVKYEPEMELSPKLLGLPVGESNKDGGGFVRGVIRSLVRTFADEVVSSIEDVKNERLGVDRKYMMKDPNDVANRIRMED